MKLPNFKCGSSTILNAEAQQPVSTLCWLSIVFLLNGMAIVE
jgi:hypothetical protein